MKNKELQTLLKQYPDDVEILTIMDYGGHGSSISCVEKANIVEVKYNEDLTDYEGNILNGIIIDIAYRWWKNKETDV